MNGINRAIKQEKFSSEYQKGIVSILYIYNLIKNQQKAIFDSYKITPQQFNVLRILRGSLPNACSIGILKERMLDKMSDASRLVDRLIILSLVAKCENKADRRVAQISITQKGLDLLSKMDYINNQFNEIINVLSEDEIIALNDLFSKIIDRQPNIQTLSNNT